jgi:hypothetical protein
MNSLFKGFHANENGKETVTINGEKIKVIGNKFNGGRECLR